MPCLELHLYLLHSPFKLCRTGPKARGVIPAPQKPHFFFNSPAVTAPEHSDLAVELSLLRKVPVPKHFVLGVRTSQACHIPCWMEQLLGIAPMMLSTGKERGMAAAKTTRYALVGRGLEPRPLSASAWTYFPTWS